MTFLNLEPNSTSANTGAVTGSSAHAALSDGSDATYVDFDYGEAAVFGLTDLTLPSGAVIVSAQAWARVAKLADGPSALNMSVVADSTATGNASVTWDIPTNAPTTAFIFGGLSDAGLDAALLGVWNTALSSLRVYHAWIRVLLLVKPTVAVTSPSGTIGENIVTVTWQPAFDPHADPSHFWEVKLFSQAQYSAGGFDPSSSTPTASRVGQGYNASCSFPNTTLPDGNYRAYVRVAAGNSSSQWSDWSSSTFTVAAPAPGNPLVSVTADNPAGCLQVLVQGTSGSASTTHLQAQRQDAWGNWVNIKTVYGNGLASGSIANFFDYEAPINVLVTYRARAYNSSSNVYSPWVTSTPAQRQSTDEWLKCLLRPALNMRLTVKSYAAFEVPGNVGVFRPLGSSKGVAVADVPGPEQGQIVVFSKTHTDRVNLSALLESGSPILIQVPGHPDRCVRFGDRSSSRVVDMAAEEWHEETLSWTAVESPDVPLA